MKRYHRGGKESAALCPEEAANEFLVVCPACKTMETLLSINGQVVTNRKFVQREGGIFHNCGSVIPCRVYGQRATLETSTRPEKV